MTEMERFIREYSASIGLNPNVVMQTVLNEGGRQSLEPSGYARRSLVGGSGAGQEPSYGPFQMHMRYLGGRALRAGYDPRDPSQAFNVAKFAMDEIKRAGLGQWHGWKGDPMAAHRGGQATNASVSVPEGPANGSSAPSDTAMLFSPSADMGDPLIYERLRGSDPYSQLASDLSQSVAARRRTSGGGGEISAPRAAPVAITPAPEFASATPEASVPPAAADAAPPPAVSPLAELFKVADIGMAAATNPKTGVPVLPRQRRTAG